MFLFFINLNNNEFRLDLMLILTTLIIYLGLTIFYFSDTSNFVFSNLEFHSFNNFNNAFGKLYLYIISELL